MENVLPSPDLSSASSSTAKSDIVVSDKLSDIHTNNERTNLNKQEEIVIISKSDRSNDGGVSAQSEHEIRSEKILSNTHAEVVSQQPHTIESSENVDKIPEQKITTQKITDDNV